MKKYRQLIFKFSNERKTLYYVLKRVKGVGLYRSRKILIRLGFPIHNMRKRLRQLTTVFKWKFYHTIVRETSRIQHKEPSTIPEVKRYKDYRAIFHLPLRGQRTKTNASTAKKGRVIVKAVEKKGFYKPKKKKKKKK
jgi:ribosomal protein S13